MNDIRTIDNDTLLGEICSLLSQGKSVKLRAKGNSMQPFIHGNEDILILTPSDFFSMGDVVLAKIEEKRYVVHRIIKIKGDRITLMGDGNLYETEVCTQTDIFGSVKSVIRNGKERNLNSLENRLSAMAWRCLLPLRRLKLKLSNRIIRK